MKRSLVAVLLGLLTLTSCQVEPPLEPVELPFATHPSVLRGDWVGTVANTPESKNSTLELTDITAECDNDPEDNALEGQCISYAFTGSISVDGGAPVPITGSGFAGGYIYTLTTPRRLTEPQINGRFELNGEEWDFRADYRSFDYPDIEADPTFEGTISSGVTGGIFSFFCLEPANSQERGCIDY